MELFKLFGKIAIDNTEAKAALDDTSKKAKDSEKNTESAFAKIGGAAKTVAVGIGAAGVAIGGAFIGAVEGTREYRQEMGLLESAFKTAGHSTEEAKNTYSDLNAVLGDSGQAVRQETSGITKTIIEQNKLLMDFLQKYMPKSVRLDSGALVGELDTRLGQKYMYLNRGNTR